jgi:hypothetical protein
VGGVKGRLTKLERESEGLFQTLTLEEGTKVRYAPEEMLNAISAAIHGREHRLLPFVRRKGTRQGLAGLINALEDSRARVEEEREDGA